MRSLERRTFLRLAAGTAGAACLPLNGCGRAPAADSGPLRLELAELPEGVRVRWEWAGEPLEILRRDGRITARSLLCTHQGCEVVWSAADAAYICPCHDGRFDAAGRPVYGPPRNPLREIVVRQEGGQAVLGD